MKILITGASGFIGGAIVAEALARGHEVWAAVRPTSSRERLADPRLHVVELDFADRDALRQRLAGLRPDCLIHAAGATKCLHADDFYRANTTATRNIAEAFADCGAAGGHMVFLSSLSVLGPVRDGQPGTALCEADEPRPDTHYGRSKLLAEQALAEVTGLDYVVIRPTGVYGPWERDYYMMVKSIAGHLDFAAGYKPQCITFVYVSDLVEAVFLALERGQTGRKYIISDGQAYTSRTFSDLVRRELGHPWMLRMKAPLWLLRLITLGGEAAGRLTGRMTALNNDKYHIMRQRNWLCDISPARLDLGYKPRVTLAEGVRLTVAWYREHGWI